VRKIPVRLPPPLPQDSVRQNVRAQEQSGGGGQDHTRTADPQSMGLGYRLCPFHLGQLRRLHHDGSFNTGLGRSFLLDLLYGGLDHLGRPFNFYLGLSPVRYLNLFRNFLLLPKSYGREKEHGHNRKNS
jgi:hypothetical protein